MILSANAQGTVSNSAVQARLQLTGARRADFVPAQPLDVDLQCLGTATGDFHSFQDIHCSWPPAGSSNPPTLAISGAIPDIRNPNSAAIEIGTPGLPAATLLDWLRIASSRVPADIAAAGTLTGSLSYQPRPSQPHPLAGRNAHHQRQPHQPPLRRQPHSSPATSPSNPSLRRPLTSITRNSHPPPRPRADSTSPPSLSPSAAKTPQSSTATFDTTGYTLHLTGMASIARLHALAAALPQLGDGLAEVLPTNRAAGPFRIDLTATRPWRGIPNLDRQHRPPRTLQTQTPPQLLNRASATRHKNLPPVAQPHKLMPILMWH